MDQEDGYRRLTNGACRKVSYPELYNDVFRQNRSFYIGVGALGTGTLNQQHVVSLYNAFTGTRAASRRQTGACPTGASFWDIGGARDTGPANHASTVTLSPEASFLTSTAGYPGGGTGFGVKLGIQSGRRHPVLQRLARAAGIRRAGLAGASGIADATVPNPIFNLTPAATVDEGNNWVNISWVRWR